MIYEELWTDELLDEPYAAELKEKIENTIERKDLDQLTEIIRNIEIAVGEVPCAQRAGQLAFCRGRTGRRA